MIGLKSFLSGLLLLVSLFQPTPLYAQQRDTLLGDARLNAKVTLVRRDAPLLAVLAELTKQTKVLLTVGGNELPAQSLAVAVKDEPLRDVLRALATLNGAYWKQIKTPQGQDCLQLMDISADPRYWDFLRPHSEAEAERNKSLDKFQQQLSQLTPDMQQAFVAGGPGVSFDNLSSGMQQSVRDALNAQNQMFAFKHTKYGLTEDSLGNTSVTMEAHVNEGSTDYSIHLSGPFVSLGGGVGVSQGATMSVSVPNDPAARDNTVLPADFIPWQRGEQEARAAKEKAAHDNAVQTDPRLTQMVSVKSDETTLGYPLAALAETAHVNIIARIVHQAHVISLGPIPLKEALDKIGDKYHATWTEAADGTILLFAHGNGSPAPKTAVK